MSSEVAPLAAWDAALGAVREQLRGWGLMEVSTPFVVPAVAVEPFIEPVPVGASFVITSPELAMKRLLCRHRRSIFQVARVRRAGERSDNHLEEFHLVEWYRVGADLERLHHDVAAIVDAVRRAVADSVGRPPPAPATWERHAFFDVLEATTGVSRTRAAQPAGAAALLQALRGQAGVVSAPEVASQDDPELWSLATWTELFSLWSDLHLDPWLAERTSQGVAVHLELFPPPLAALSQLDEHLDHAHRFESHLEGVELANGYLELSDPVAQRERFELVNRLRAGHDMPPLPLDEAFLRALEDPGLPPCVGVALGLDRLVMLACGARSLGEIDPLD